ncbi:MAG TPA: glycosyltransferase [Luteimicrobium sp.]|nr:glycosyltransferase [Luteimicrobium sp.]
MTDGVALAHDYATQRGGAERVALVMADAFPGSPMYTTLYDPDGTFPEFSHVPLRVSPLNRVPALRHDHRLALPFLAPAVSFQRVVDADVLLASSSGWAHGYRGARRTVVYCYIPARWLYQRDRYLGGQDAGGGLGTRLRSVAASSGLTVLTPALKRWDARAAHRADTYLVCSTVAQRAVREVYGFDAEVLAPPPAMMPGGPSRPTDGVAPGFFLCVARLLPYKNVDVVIDAAQRLGKRDLVIVGDGPERARLEALAARSSDVRVHVLGRVDDDELRWLYGNAEALVAASYEDFGLSPLEAGAFGRPSVALRAGGFLDSVREGETGVFFDELDAGLLADALGAALEHPWDEQVQRDHAASFGTERFVRRLRDVVGAGSVTGR